MADVPQWFDGDEYLSDSSTESIPVVGDALMQHPESNASDVPGSGGSGPLSTDDNLCAICTRLSADTPVPVYPPAPTQAVRSADDVVSLVAAYARVADRLYVAQADLRSANAELQTHARDLHRGIGAATGEAREFLAFCESRYAQAQQRLVVGQEEREHLVAELVRLQEALENTEETNRADRARLVTEVARLQAALHDSQSEIEALRSQVNTLDGVLQDVIAGNARERERLRAEVHSLTDRHAQERTSANTTGSRASSTDSACGHDTLIDDLRTQLQVIPQLQSEVAVLKQTAQDSTALLAAAEQNRRRAEAERDAQAAIALQRSNESAALRADKARLEANLARTSFQRGSSAIGDLRRELGQIRAASAIARDRARQQARRHLATINELRSELDRTRTSAATEISQLIRSRDDLTDEVAASRLSLAVVEAERDARSNALRQLRRALAGVRAAEQATLHEFQRVSAQYQQHVLATSAAVRADRERITRERDAAVSACRDLERQLSGLRLTSTAELHSTAADGLPHTEDAEVPPSVSDTDASSCPVLSLSGMPSVMHAIATPSSALASPVTTLHRLDAVVRSSAENAAAVLTRLAAETGSQASGTAESGRSMRVRQREPAHRSVISTTTKRARLTPLPEAVSGLPGTYRMPRAIFRPGEPRQALRMQARTDWQSSSDDGDDEHSLAGRSPASGVTHDAGRPPGGGDTHLPSASLTVSPPSTPPHAADSADSAQSGGAASSGTPRPRPVHPSSSGGGTASSAPSETTVVVERPWSEPDNALLSAADDLDSSTPPPSSLTRVGASAAARTQPLSPSPRSSSLTSALEISGAQRPTPSRPPLQDRPSGSTRGRSSARSTRSSLATAAAVSPSYPRRSSTIGSPASGDSSHDNSSESVSVADSRSGDSDYVPPVAAFTISRPIPGSPRPVRFRERDVRPWPTAIVSTTTLSAVTEPWLAQLTASPRWLFPVSPIAKPKRNQYNPELITWSQVSAMLEAEPWSVLEVVVPPISFDLGDPDFARVVAEFTHIRETWCQPYWESTHYLPIPPDGGGDLGLVEYIEQRRQRRSRLGARLKVLFKLMADLMHQGRCDVDLLLDPYFMLPHPRSTARHWYPVEDHRPGHRGNLLYALALLDQREPWRNQFRDDPARHPGRQFDRIIGKFMRPSSV